MKLRRVIYTSQATNKFSKRKFLDLLHDSRAYNKIDNITGLLMHHQGCFLQIIEGGEDAVHDLLFRLQNDERHNNLCTVLDTIVESRLFSNWTMGCADFDDPELSFLPGVRTDLSDSKVIEDLVIRLPEISVFLQNN